MVKNYIKARKRVKAKGLAALKGKSTLKLTLRGKK